MSASQQESSGIYSLALFRASIPLLVFMMIALSGCSGPIRPQMISGDNISTQHGIARTQDAFEGARAYCAKRGKGIKTVRSDCPEWCWTTYECVNEQPPL